MLEKKRAHAVLLLLMLLISAAPTLVFAAEGTAEPQEDEAAKALQRRGEVMLRIAVRTADRIADFIGKVQESSVLLERLKDAGLLDDFDGNVSAFEDARNMLDEAETLIENGNYTLALERVKEALTIFRDVYRAVHRIKGELTGTIEVHKRAEGLIVAMNRTLERLERAEELAEEADENISRLIDQARDLLNLTEARILLEAGNVSEAAHRLAEANRIVSLIYAELKVKAHMKIRERAIRYLKIAEKFRENVMERVRIAWMAGVNVTEALQKLRVNTTALKGEFMKRIREAMEKGDVKEMLKTLRNLGRELWKIDRAVTHQIMEHLRGKLHRGPFGRGQPPVGGEENITESHHPAERHRGSRSRRPGGGGE